MSAGKGGRGPGHPWTAGLGKGSPQGTALSWVPATLGQGFLPTAFYVSQVERGPRVIPGDK